MKNWPGKILLILSLINPFFSHAEHGPGSIDTAESISIHNESDTEQQQLEWCFRYSNLLGIELTRVNNPKLYDNIGEWMGTPYKYAGKTKSGIDCSGLVCRLIRDSYDIDLTGTSRDLHSRSVRIKKNELKEGDLVFFKIRKGRISHVGIYLGENKFAHASLKLGVIVSDLNDPYYSKHFYSAGRLIE